MTPRPDPGQLDQLLRSCVQCGLCLPTCATWAATGNEVLSPRGRLVLMQDLLAAPQARPDPDAMHSFDLCIGCRACETACPSGVPFSLFEYGKDLARQNRPGGPTVPEKPAVPGWLSRRMDRVPVLRALRTLSRFAVGRRLANLVAGMPMAPRRDADLIAMLNGLMDGPPPALGGGELPARAAGPTLDFFTGCASAGLLPDTSRRLIDLLRHAGCEVRIPAHQVCCGALAAHTGRPRDRQEMIMRNRSAFAQRPAADWIVVEAAGCGLDLKQQDDFSSAEILDATEALVRLAPPPVRPVPLKVTYHAACHLEHGQGVAAAPRSLLSRIPDLELVEPEGAALCCGSGGIWSLEHPTLAAEVGAIKAAHLIETGAQLVVTTNPGCLGQIKGALAAQGVQLPVLPLTDLLWFAFMNI